MVFVGDISIVHGVFVTQVITYYGGTTLQERLVGFCTKKHGACRANHRLAKSPLVDFSGVEGLTPNKWDYPVTGPSIFTNFGHYCIDVHWEGMLKKLLVLRGDTTNYGNFLILDL